MGWGAKPPKCRLGPTAKHTGQESGGELCEIVTFWSFLESKSVNNVCKLLQLLSPIPLAGTSPLDFTSGLHGTPPLRFHGSPLSLGAPPRTKSWRRTPLLDLKLPRPDLDLASSLPLTEWPWPWRRGLV